MIDLCNRSKCWNYRFPLDSLERCLWALPCFQWHKIVKSLHSWAGPSSSVWERWKSACDLVGFSLIAVLFGLPSRLSDLVAFFVWEGRSVDSRLARSGAKGLIGPLIHA